MAEIKQRMLDAGCQAPLIGDFHYNGHLLLTRYPDAARALDKYRINPGNVGTGKRRDEQFATICKVAVDDAQTGAHRRERRLAQSGARHGEDAGEHGRRPSDCRPRRSSTSAWCSRRSSRPTWRSSAGLTKQQIIISCKVSRPRDLIAVYRELARRTDQPLHLGLTEAGMGIEGHRVVGLGARHSAQRGHRRHDSRLAHASARRRPPRGGLRRVRDSAGAGPAFVLPVHHGMPGLRPDHVEHVPGTGRARAGLRPDDDAGLESRRIRAWKR